MSLNYTPLRHKMLAAIADGKVRTKPGQGWRFEVDRAHPTRWPVVVIKPLEES